MQLSILVEERRAIVAVAGSLMSRVISRPTAPTQEDQAHVYEELRRLARALAIQVARQRLHLATIAVWFLLSLSTTALMPYVSECCPRPADRVPLPSCSWHRGACPRTSGGQVQAFHLRGTIGGDV